MQLWKSSFPDFYANNISYLQQERSCSDDKDLSMWRIFLERHCNDIHEISLEGFLFIYGLILCQVNFQVPT